ncbi:MAG: flagellar hook-associated protein FlgK [Zoogloeaceae bacterium]|jgi:flagellar hook-associated protein 1 FlgK|nr:flagellar hook-associated protein FlgK [Zoogloeaceae bacterium]
MSLLNTGLSALATAQLGLATTQHNIANANTPGYSRQAIMQATNSAVYTGAGFVGQGVHTNTILRSYSDILTKHLNEAQSKASELDTYNAMISRIDSLLADSNAGISPVLAGFFQGVQDVAANPGLTSARQSMLSSAQALVTRFQVLDDRLTQMADETNTQIRDSVNLINGYGKQIANLNEKIIQVISSGQPPNDLMDARDQLVLELNKLVRVSTVQDSDGSLNIFAGMGQQLVVGNRTVELEARPSAADPERIIIGQKGGTELPESYFDGGSVGGLLAFRREALEPAFNSLGKLSASVALTVNAQQALGQDLLNNVQGDPDFIERFFKTSDPKGINNSGNNRVSYPNGAFTGNIDSFSFLPPEISSEGNFYTQLTGSDYEARFDGSNFVITRLSDQKVVGTVAEGVDLEFDGLKIRFTSGHAAGDKYLLQPTREVGRNMTVNQDIAADVRKIAAASPIRTGASSTNIGDAVISPGEVVDANYAVPASEITLQYNKATGTLNLTSGTPGTVTVNGVTATFPIPYNSGDTINIDGFEFAINGTPGDDGTPGGGDTFTIGANIGGIADSRNIVRIGNLQTAMTMNGDALQGKGNATFQVDYAQLVSDIGTKTKTAQVSAESQQVLLQQANEARESTAGVNLDEEYAHMLEYQLSYQAAARMMDTVSKMFDIIISIGR